MFYCGLFDLPIVKLAQPRGMSPEIKTMLLCPENPKAMSMKRVVKSIDIDRNRS